MTEYNPFYDNTYESNQSLITRQQVQQANYSRPLQMGAKNVLQRDDPKAQSNIANQILNQIETRESLKKRERQAQWDYERKIQQQGIVYLQRQPNQQLQPVQQQQQPPSQQFQQPPQQSPPRYQQDTSQLQARNRSHIPPDKETLSGGIFAGVFDKKEQSKQIQMNERQAYADEIQRQIDEKRRKKEEEAKRKQEEDIRYEEQVKRDMEELKRRYQQEEEKKQQEIKSLQAQQDQRRMEMQAKEYERINKNKKRSVDQQYSKLLNDTHEQQNEPQGDQTIPLGNITQQIIPPFLQDSVEYRDDPQNQSWREFNQASRKSTNRQPSNHQPYNQPYNQPSHQNSQRPSHYQQQYQQPPHDYQEQTYQLPPNKQTMLMDQFVRGYEEVLAQNRLKAMEQEQELKTIRNELDQQVNVLQDGLRMLRVEEQMTLERKRNAFQELDHLRDELKRQELKEQQRTQQYKQFLLQPRMAYQQEEHQYFVPEQQPRYSRQQMTRVDDFDIGQDQQFVPINGGMGDIMLNRIDGRLMGFEESNRLEANIANL